MQLLIAYLILFAIGSVLSFFGHSMTYQAGTATAGLTPAAESHSGQVISGIGFVFIVAGLVVAVLAVVRMIRSRNTTDGSATRPDKSGTAD
jgi:membrane protein DedA with SNARE-associated domain